MFPLTVTFNVNFFRKIGCVASKYCDFCKIALKDINHIKYH